MDHLIVVSKAYLRPLLPSLHLNPNQAGILESYVYVQSKKKLGNSILWIFTNLCRLMSPGNYNPTTYTPIIIRVQIRRQQYQSKRIWHMWCRRYQYMRIQGSPRHRFTHLYENNGVDLQIVTLRDQKNVGYELLQILVDLQIAVP